MKIRTNVSVEEVILDQARKENLNVSGLLEEALRNKLRIVEIEIKEPLKCEFCGIEGKPETRETTSQSSNGLTFLYPDERWICNSCLGRRYMKGFEIEDYEEMLQICREFWRSPQGKEAIKNSMLREIEHEDKT